MRQEKTVKPQNPKCDESGMGRDESGALGTNRANLGTNPPLRVSHHPGPRPLLQTKNRNHFMSTANTTNSHDTGQHTTRRATTQPSNTLTTQLECSAAQRLRTTMATVRLAFTWLGVRKTLAPEQRTTAARAFHADRELLSAG